MIINFEDDIKACTRCPLRENATAPVVGIGSLDADILLLGEAPGQNEDKTGIPFSGRSGQILRDGMREIGLDMTNTYISNIVKCRPPNNRTPHKSEIKVCSIHTETIINSINPILIVAIGNTAINYFLEDRNIKPGDVIGKIITANIHGYDRYIYCIRHPAYALHSHDKTILENIQKNIRDIKVAFDTVKRRIDAKH